METIGSGAVTAPFTAVKDSDVIIVIGANPTENHPVAATYFKQAAKRGAELIVMDPRGTALTRHATHMLQFRNGSDVALLNAIMNVIITEQLYDTQYIQAHTEGFERLKSHIAPFTPEAMEPVCGIDAGVIRAVARKYAKANAAIIFWGMGVSQHTHGTDNARCLISLALMCGQVGRAGTGLHPLRGQNNVQGASDAGLIPMMFPDYVRVGITPKREMLESLWGAKLDPEPGLTVVEVMDAIHAGVIKGMYIQGENPAMSDPDVGHAREALAMLEHLVVQDIFLTETAMFADVILPATAWPEKVGTVSNTNRQVQMGRKAIEAPGDVRPDWWIIIEIAKRMGLAWTYRHPSEVFAEMKLAMPSLDNISWERLERESSVTYPCSAPDMPGEEIVFGDRFPTETGLGKMVPARLIPPDELPDREFPFVLSTGRQLEHWHTGAMTRRSSVLDAVEPEPTVQMNPLDIARFGLSPGDMVRVASRRGTIDIKVRSDSAVAQGVVFIPFAYVEAAANLLTNPKLDPFGKIPEFKFCAVKVEALGESGRQAAE
jgi:formate dehydrogenase major subunit